MRQRHREPVPHSANRRITALAVAGGLFSASCTGADVEHAQPLQPSEVVSEVGDSIDDYVTIETIQPSIVEGLDEEVMTPMEFTPTDTLQAEASFEIGKFREWLGDEEGIITEWGIPNDRLPSEQQRWNRLASFMLQRAACEDIGWAAWSSGHAWGQSYDKSIFSKSLEGRWQFEASAIPIIAHLSDDVPVTGVSYAGFEFYAEDRTPPTVDDLLFHKNQGVNLIRYPLRWNNMQPELNQPLNDGEREHLLQVLDNAQEAGILIMLDIHNYAEWNNIPITAIRSEYHNFLQQLISAYGDHPALHSLEIMNEPAEISTQDWEHEAQAAYDFIRDTGWQGQIIVPIGFWAGIQGIYEYHPNGPFIERRSGDTALAYSGHYYPNLIGVNGRHDSSFKNVNGTPATYEENVAQAGASIKSGTFEC